MPLILTGAVTDGFARLAQQGMPLQDRLYGHFDGFSGYVARSRSGPHDATTGAHGRTTSAPGRAMASARRILLAPRRAPVANHVTHHARDGDAHLIAAFKGEEDSRFAGQVPQLGSHPDV